MPRHASMLQCRDAIGNLKSTSMWMDTSKKMGVFVTEVFFEARSLTTHFQEAQNCTNHLVKRSGCFLVVFFLCVCESVNHLLRDLQAWLLGCFLLKNVHEVNKKPHYLTKFICSWMGRETSDSDDDFSLVPEQSHHCRRIWIWYFLYFWWQVLQREWRKP